MKRLLLVLLLPVTVHAQHYNPGQSFTSITVDSNFNVWAGAGTGVYFMDKLNNPQSGSFSQLGGTSLFAVKSIKADMNGNVWVGHAGRGGNTAVGGGMERIDMNNPGNIVHLSPDRNAECFQFFERDGLATLHNAHLAVNKYGTVWSAQKYHDLTVSPDYILTPGSLSFKTASAVNFVSKGTYRDYQQNAEPSELPYPAYTCNTPGNRTPQSRNHYSVAAWENEVWTSVAAYESKRDGTVFPARLVKYNYLGEFTGVTESFATIGIPAGGIFNGLVFSKRGDLWVSISAANKGIAVKRDGNWIYLNAATFSCLIPGGFNISENAMWSNETGQVFIGTSKGLLVYDGKGPVSSVNSYSVYSTANGVLPSNRIYGGVSEKDSIQWVVTDNGIMRTTLGRNYFLSADSADYTFCDNPVINQIEAQSSADNSWRKDYHSYKVETEVCSTDGPNGDKCNAKFIYQLMKADVSLTAPTPSVFPYDNLSTSLITFVSDEELNEISENVNAWDSDEPIPYIKSVLSAAMILKYYSMNLSGKMPFSKYADAIPRKNIEAIQNSRNPASVEACAPYYLYNSPNFMYDRLFFQSFTPCGSQLEDIQFDRVWIYPNDRELSITNYTQPGHMLSPGKVFRYLVEECGKVKVVTIGTGLSDCGNNIQGTQNGNGNHIAGSIMFKNIDLKLKKAFREAQ